jgi:hypothetical protein
MKIIRTYPEEVYNKDGVRIMLVGKTKKKYNCLVYEVLMRDQRQRLWRSGEIFMSIELIDDPEVDHFQFMIEMGKERLMLGLKHEMNEN